MDAAPQGVREQEDRPELHPRDRDGAGRCRVFFPAHAGPRRSSVRIEWGVAAAIQAVCRDSDSLRPLFMAALQMLYQIDLLEGDRIIAWHSDRQWQSGAHTEAELALHADVRYKKGGGCREGRRDKKEDRGIRGKTEG